MIDNPSKTLILKKYYIFSPYRKYDDPFEDNQLTIPI